MFVPAEEKTFQLEIKKSVFIATVYPVDSEETVKLHLHEKRADHPKCSHVVWAYILGGEKNQLMGMSDDGEPKGTAGKPLLSVLQYSGMTNILVAVVRYFGGTKLGKGGLVKAYTDSAKGVIEEVPKKELIKEVELRLICGYKHFDGVKAALELAGARIVTEKFGSDISITVSAAEEGVEELKKNIRDSSSGTAVITAVSS